MWDWTLDCGVNIPSVASQWTPLHAGDNGAAREHTRHNTQFAEYFFCLNFVQIFSFTSPGIPPGTKFDTLTLNGFPERKMAKFIWDDTDKAEAEIS